MLVADAIRTHSRPRLVAIGGLSGTGKSTLARLLCERMPDAVWLRSDVERKAMLGVEESVRLGQEGYTAEVTGRVYRRLAEQAGVALADGRPVIVDAVFGRAHERDLIAAAAGGAVFIGLWLEAPYEQKVRRVADRRNDVSDATVEVVARQATYDTGVVAWSRVDAGRTADATLAQALAILGAVP